MGQEYVPGNARPHTLSVGRGNEVEDAKVGPALWLVVWSPPELVYVRSMRAVGLRSVG
jgi:hypothetical protein